MVRLGSDLDDAVGCLHGFGLAVKLVAEAFDVVHAVGDDDRVTVQGAFDSGLECCAGIFLGARSGVDIAVESEGVVVDVVQFYALDARLGGIRYALFKLADQLLAAICLARLGKPG